MRCIKCRKDRKLKKGLCKACRSYCEQNKIKNYSEHFDLDSFNSTDTHTANGSESGERGASNGNSNSGS